MLRIVQEDKESTDKQIALLKASGQNPKLVEQLEKAQADWQKKIEQLKRQPKLDSE